MPKPLSTAAIHHQHERLLIGISACLLGKPVRFDQGHKLNQYLVKVLSNFVDYVSVCPEVEIGLGTPRPTIQLRKQNDDIELVVSKDPSQNLTSTMTDYAREKAAKLGELDGFIFKKDSPSCGAFRVPVVIHEDGMKKRIGIGLFAKVFQEQHPLIPVEDEGRLNDTALKENFFERVYAYRRWKNIESPESNVKGLIDFHSKHKFMLLARGSEYYQELGRIISGVTRNSLAERRVQYIQRFMEVMKMTSKPGRQVNVLMHIMGYLKYSLSPEDKRELLSVFEAYRLKQMPLITPVTLLKHHLRNHPQKYIINQFYLNPFPESLALRSSLS